MTHKTMLTSEKNFPIWCYGCGARADYEKVDGYKYRCKECGHLYFLPKRHTKGYKE